MAKGCSRLRGRVPPALTAAIAACGAIAPAAALAATTAPTMKIKVPAKVHPNEAYKVVISVTYDRTSLRTTPYLLSYLQFNGAPCKSTASTEVAMRGVVVGNFAGRVPGSPFIRTENWKAGTLTGGRRVCAYLFAKRVSQKSRSKPLLTAGKFFRNV
jgi:hypothetical protein